MFIGLGILTGILGFLPLYISLQLLRRSTSTQALTVGLYGLGGALVSLVLLAGLLITCAMLARDSLLPFAIAEIVAFLVCTITYVVYKNVFAKRKPRK